MPVIDCPLNRNKVKRGSQLSWSKLNESDVASILSLVEYRDKLKRELAEMTNAKIAEKFDVHVRTIDRVTTGENWSHVVAG
jgi:hypothetical protein